MSGFDNYDQWKTASPYDDVYPDDICAHCGAPLPANIEDDDIAFEGFCSEKCKAENEAGEKAPPCIRPLFDFLNGEFGMSIVAPDYGEAPWQWSRAIYKGTSCGAWLELSDEANISIGSIVEGSDVEIGPYYLTWPFAKEAFWNLVAEVNSEASEAWDEANIEQLLDME